MLFNERKQAFYIPSELDSQLDSKEISDEQYAHFLEKINSGYYVYLKNGEFTISSERTPGIGYSFSSEQESWVLIDHELKHDFDTENAENLKQRLINEANQVINSKQWPSKLALNRLSEEDKSTFNLWLDYLDALEAVDTSTAPDIAWPPTPA